MNSSPWISSALHARSRAVAPEVGSMVHVSEMCKLVEKDCNPSRNHEHSELELMTFL